jgi:DNA-binding transcriptional MerR regulator
MPHERPLTIGAVARMAGITVRTLHHYDRIGLLRPTGRSVSGYRQYTEADIERLQRILFYRELELGLEQIHALLLGEAQPAVHLRRQHQLVLDRIERLRRLADAIELTLEASEMDIKLTPEERLEVFGAHDPDEHAAEAQDRWGGTDLWAESKRRVAGYSKADWERIKAEGGAAVNALAEAMAAGEPPTGAAAMDAAEAHRRHIDSAYYPCPPAAHRGLAELYIADARFAATYEAIRPGLAQFVHDAIVANADRQVRPGG